MRAGNFASANKPLVGRNGLNNYMISVNVLLTWSLFTNHSSLMENILFSHRGSNHRLPIIGWPLCPLNNSRLYRTASTLLIMCDWASHFPLDPLGSDLCHKLKQLAVQSFPACVTGMLPRPPLGDEQQGLRSFIPKGEVSRSSDYDPFSLDKLLCPVYSDLAKRPPTQDEPLLSSVAFSWSPWCFPLTLESFAII